MAASRFLVADTMTQTTPRQRVWQAIRHQQPDRVPWHFGYTVGARQKLEQHFGTADLDAVLGNHLLKYHPRASDAVVEVRPGFWRDDFGVLWNRTIDKNIGTVAAYPLQNRSLADYTFPDPHDPRRYAKVRPSLAAHADRFRYISVSFSLFERAWTLRGMEQLLMDMLEAPQFVDELLDAITAFDLGILEEVLPLDIDGVLFGDDWGQQSGLLFGRRLWQRFIQPRIANSTAP